MERPRYMPRPHIGRLNGVPICGDYSVVGCQPLTAVFGFRHYWTIRYINELVMAEVSISSQGRQFGSQRIDGATLPLYSRNHKSPIYRGIFDISRNVVATGAARTACKGMLSELGLK